MLRAGIRLAQLADIERLQWVEIDAGQRFHAVGLHAIAEDDPPAGEVLAAKVAQGRLWVAERVGGEPAEHGPVGVLGYAAASTVDGHAHLDQVSVIGEAAGRGIGAQLLAAVEDWAKAAGLDTLTLTTFREVPWNGPYYRRLGFVELDGATFGPQLAAIRAREQANGLELLPRCAMGKGLLGAPSPR